MRAEDRLEEMERRRQELISFVTSLDEQLRNSEINQIEHAVLLHESFKGKGREEVIRELDESISELSEQAGKEHRAKLHIGIAGAALAIIAIISLFSQSNYFSPTGFVIGPRESSEIISYNNAFVTPAETLLELANITSLRISGSLEGTRATVKLRINGIEYLVGEITPGAEGGQDNLITGLAIGEEASPYTISTDKAEYLVGEEVFITITPEAEDKSLYIAYGDQMNKLDEGASTYLPAAAGEYQAIALIVLDDDIVRVETGFTVAEASSEESEAALPETQVEPTPEEVISEEPAAEATEADASELAAEPQEPEAEQETTTGYEFSNVCVDTCNLEETSNPILIIELEEGSKLTITELIITRNKENTAPEQVKDIPNIAIGITQSATISLDEYFIDPDGDSLVYDLNDIPEINADISQSELAITSDTPGVYTGYIYATDGDKLVTSNTFTITVTEEGEGAVQPGAEEVGDGTGEVPVTPVPSETEAIDPCANPDPNLRPPECMEGKEKDYFVVESVFLKDSSRANAARITPLGNLMIKGVLVESSDMSPGANDFKVTYMDSDYNDVPIAWIDSATGDLHLKGSLYEEDFFLQPTPSAFVIQNKRNVNLAYIDRTTGDLHIKGNLVQMRENVE
ncbi:hypothetical protein JXB28_00175 [Candidatus Woesearchaeota archaeon]|nr:hypothetical protein [Candidatus Woesearchaeota archaeon]